jgi:primosomal protein N' (replication factor Y)
LGKHYIVLNEELKQGYKPLQLRKIRLAKAHQNQPLDKLFETLGRAEKQRQLLLGILQMGGEKEELLAAAVLKKSGTTNSALKALEKKGLVEVFYGAEKKSLPNTSAATLPVLSELQAETLENIIGHFQKQSVCLLHGVTASGKTEIYAHLIQNELDRGRSVLYLVPEIALTTQLIRRLEHYFGKQVLVYHSRYSDRERAELYLKISKSQQAHLVLGARSALFMPLQNLGLSIVDEEHENSFKQQDPAPRYHARDAAIVMAQQQKAKVLLGSATPSFESYLNTKIGKYALVKLDQRYGKSILPRIETIDLKEVRRRKELKGHFSDKLLDAIADCLKKQKQIILFQNRRGFSTFLQCQSCGDVLQCVNCDISLTYHKHQHQLRCHYCGYHTAPPKQCPSCKSHELRSLGFGTEKLEDDLKIIFPEATVQRMDLDTTRKKGAYERIINEFENGLTDILVGTQMVTKGLDFDKVGLVGILNADTLLNFPDFRSFEKAYQLLAQVAGRAGRKEEQGLVLIQTSQTEHQAIEAIQKNRWANFYEQELRERLQFHYPPYYRLIRITIKHKKQAHLEIRAQQLSQILKQKVGSRLLGPAYPLNKRLKNWYQMELIVKVQPKDSRKKLKQALTAAVIEFEQQYPERKPRIIYDVDPY